MKMHQNSSHKISRMRVLCQNQKLQHKTSLMKLLRMRDYLLQKKLRIAKLRILNRNKSRTAIKISFKLKKNKKIQQRIPLKTLLRMESVKKILKMRKELRLRVVLKSKILQMKIASTILQNKNHNLIVNLMLL